MDNSKEKQGKPIFKANEDGTGYDMVLFKVDGNSLIPTEKTASIVFCRQGGVSVDSYFLERKGDKWFTKEGEEVTVGAKVIEVNVEKENGKFYPTKSPRNARFELKEENMSEDKSKTMIYLDEREMPPLDGIVHEHLISLLIFDVSQKLSEMKDAPDEVKMNVSQSILKLKEALMWLSR